MGLRKGIGQLLHPIKAVTEQARDTIENLEDNVDHWRDKAAREHDLRVEGLAYAKVAVARAQYETAITQANNRVAVAEAKARGIAQGNAMGYQRALDETDFFDAGFEGGKRRRGSTSNAKQPSRVSGSQARTGGPPASLGAKRFMSERSGRFDHPPQRSQPSDHLKAHPKASPRPTQSHTSAQDTKVSMKDSAHQPSHPGTYGHSGPDHIGRPGNILSAATQRSSTTLNFVLHSPCKYSWYSAFVIPGRSFYDYADTAAINPT